MPAEWRRSSLFFARGGAGACGKKEFPTAKREASPRAARPRPRQPVRRRQGRQLREPGALGPLPPKVASPRHLFGADRGCFRPTPPPLCHKQSSFESGSAEARFPRRTASIPRAARNRAGSGRNGRRAAVPTRIGDHAAQVWGRPAVVCAAAAGSPAGLKQSENGAARVVARGRLAGPKGRGGCFLGRWGPTWRTAAKLVVSATPSFLFGPVDWPRLAFRPPGASATWTRPPANAAEISNGPHRRPRRLRLGRPPLGAGAGAAAAPDTRAQCLPLGRGPSGRGPLAAFWTHGTGGRECTNQWNPRLWSRLQEQGGRPLLRG